jgi:hypothetical protein
MGRTKYYKMKYMRKKEKEGKREDKISCVINEESSR